MTLIRSVSGVRGLTGRDITPDVARRYAAVFGSPLSGDVLVGWDSRRGGDALVEGVVEGLRGAGVRPLAGGVLPTPTVGIVVRRHGLAGGVVVTASHNPEEYEGLKFFSRRGVFLGREEMRALFDAVDAGGDPPGAPGAPPVPLERAVAEHIDLVLAAEAVAHGPDRAAGITAVVDCVNAAGSVILPALLRAMGARVVEVFTTPGAGFPHGPEPVPSNLGALGRAVIGARADLGLACDPDADRLAIVAADGTPIGEEYTLALAARVVLARRRGPVVANVSTSRLLDDVAAEFGVEIVRSAVGEANVVAKMEEVSAVVGGEGNGGVILPEVHPGRDAATAAALIVTAVADEPDAGVAGLVSRLPAYAMVKRKLTLEGASSESIDSAMIDTFPDGRPDHTDGTKMSWPDRWVHARMSGTEPVVRVIAEAADPRDAEDLAERAARALSRAT